MILVTGGAGYIGSHTCVELLNAGHDVVIIDNFSNANPVVLERINKISGKTPELVTGDVRDCALLDKVFQQYPIQAVIHFAGFKAVGESCEFPMRYYNNNLYSTIALCEAMDRAQVKNLVFSSSATVYGDPDVVPLTEDMPTRPENPYGRSKLLVEQMLSDLPEADRIARNKSDTETKPWSVALLRYFNPVGAHASGLIGEDPSGIPNNLMPFITQVAVGRREKLSIFGNDYNTPDGTGVRDYIHVVDLAKGHVKAVEKLISSELTGVHAINLGTGKGVSVLEMVHAFSHCNQTDIPYEIAPRRPGDVASYYASANKAERLLGWQASLNLNDMVKDSWYWQKNNPEGYS
ncbi:UDP-glucose 4-epimerase GalE [Thalassolituus pacificus]|uniref:UDP-glucose 4-epimerase n=1 Tax=Thalassolituus pacificus TaxID=2975440 RepID=A0A9X3ASK4_9GAMM|nr:UDP-glucose 4-epimerase GalE [Thalassolituus pacificus]MCT7360094.1 UDP-glucose 4-epimerase GalE [Thalassolituus pacificus]